MLAQETGKNKILKKVKIYIKNPSGRGRERQTEKEVEFAKTHLSAALRRDASSASMAASCCCLVFSSSCDACSSLSFSRMDEGWGRAPVHTKHSHGWMRFGGGHLFTQNRHSHRWMRSGGRHLFAQYTHNRHSHEWGQAPVHTTVTDG